VVLSKLHVQYPRRLWASVRAALLTEWRKDRIDELVKRLATFRGQLALQLLVVLNARNGTQSERLGLIEQGNKEIREVLSVGLTSMQATLGSLHQDAETTARKRHEEVVMAILTLQGGDVCTVAHPDSGERLQCDSGHTWSSTTFRKRREVNPCLLEESLELPFEDQYRYHRQTTGFSREDFTHIPEMVLKSLFFRSIDDRRELIPEAHKKTFEWVFQHPAKHERPWSNFVGWLKQGHGCYWINGKAASGKSTLMKFICQDRRTYDALSEWAGPHQLLTASFFFWKAGTSIQKSQVGLLRSILYEVLKERLDIVPSLLPGPCRAALEPRGLEPFQPSFLELKRAFTTLVNGSLLNSRICLFIDGIDEYDGDHADLTDLLVTASKSEVVKLVLSSRPIPVCVSAFSICDSLRLQDLTFQDISRFVTDRLSSHTLMRRMEQLERGATERLTSEITRKASGVFLWVAIVVKRLLESLRNYDREQEMRALLEELPADLEKLYQHMLDSIETRYRQQAYRVLQMVLRSTEVQTESPMSVLQLSYAEEDEPQQALSTQICALNPEEESWRCEATEGRMRSRCCGLIEVLDHSWHRSELCMEADVENHGQVGKKTGIKHEQPPKSLDGECAKSVAFLHRTVVEFLTTENVWQNLVSPTGRQFAPIDEVLLGSCVQEMKAKPPPDTSFSDSRVWHNMRHCLIYAEHLENSTGLLTKAYLAQIRKTMHSYAEGSDIKPMGILARHWAIHELRHEECNSLEFFLPPPFTFLACFNGLVLYLDNVLKEDLLRPDDKNLLMMHLVLNLTNERLIARRHRNVAHCIRILLEHGADPGAFVKLSNIHNKSVPLGRLAELEPSSRLYCGPSNALSTWRCVLWLLYHINADKPSKWRSWHEIQLFGTVLEHLCMAGGDLGALFQDREGQNQRAFNLVAAFVADCENELEDVAPRIRRLIEPKVQLQRAAVSSTATPSNSVVHQAKLLRRADHLSRAHPIRSKRRLDQQQARNYDSGRSRKRTSGPQARMFCSVPSDSCEANDVARSQQVSPFLPRGIYPGAEEL
jgi:hypothetical protein